MDPLTWEYPDLTPYQYSGNDPIANVDLDGLEPKNVVKKLLGSLSDQGINASSKLLEKGANAGKWLVSWIDKGGVAQLKMFASKSASALSTALNIGVKVADVGLDFVPIAGGARDIYRGVRDGNWVQAGIGALSIVADIFTFGGSSVAKGIIKNAVKEGIELATKNTVKTVAAKESVKLLGQPINITQKGLTHTLDRHTVNNLTKFAGKSKFANPSEVTTLIQQATHYPMVRQANGNFARTVDAGRNIGIDRATGQPTSIYTVITGSNGNLITAFPGTP
ncbi:hypothetical protein BC659_0777 [Sediminibacterium goheungense]|uniref:Uncharacterized protein n=1 Tax=Sediminibacterium goheungense TaxID=1086393 RepID=A0A4R6J1I0_9BACT|nr:hypothetical protein BC659_0777 [Sediminibacterium goheungense]